MATQEFYTIQKPTLDFFHKNRKNLILYAGTVILIMFIIFPYAFIRSNGLRSGDMKFDSDIIPENNSSINLGSEDKQFSEIHSNEIFLKNNPKLPPSGINGFNSKIPGKNAQIVFRNSDNTKATSQFVNSSGDIQSKTVDTKTDATDVEINKSLEEADVGTTNAEFKDLKIQSLNVGAVTVASGKDIGMSGASTFTTGTGAIALNGDVTIASGKDIGMSGASTFTTGTGAIALNGAVTASAGVDASTSYLQVGNRGIIPFPTAARTAITVDQSNTLSNNIHYTLGNCNNTDIFLPTSSTKGNYISIILTGVIAPAKMVQIGKADIGLNIGSTVIVKGGPHEDRTGAVKQSDGTSGSAFFKITGLSNGDGGLGSRFDLYYTGVNWILEGVVEPQGTAIVQTANTEFSVFSIRTLG